MNKRTLITIIPAAALLLLAACTQDEPGGQGNELPYGEYPLQISGVTLDVESSAEPWSAEGPQTRVTEDNTDGKSSVWEWNGSEMIGVRLGNETATYTLSADKNLITDRQLYWTSTAPATVAAWYPTDETVDLSDQSNGLAYMLKAEVPDATYDNEITLGFKHQLAKVRVVLNGTQAALAQSVEVYGYTTCTNNEGVPTVGSTQSWLKMKKQTYGNTECWEANVVPGNITITDFIRINGQTATVNNDFPTTLASGNMYTIDLTVGEPVTEITADNCNNISGTDNYVVSGTFNQQITITGGSPTIYLENASMNITNNGHAINIQNGNPTIYILGTNKISVNKNNYGAGIYVAENSSVTITGTSEDDVLVVTGGSGGSGIGGYTSSDYNSHPCGDITIENITVRATSNMPTVTGGYAAAIGACGDKTVGSIKINNAVVYANGGGYESYGGAGIGGGVSSLYGFWQTEFDISIADSEVYVSKGCPYASYIGAGGMRGEQTNYKIIPSANVTNSHIYDESGNEITQ